MVLNPAT
jgi:hypothetical protein